MKLENQNLTLEISLQAAEMHSLVFKATQKEWIWSGDPTYWAQRNPILFPIIGSTYDKLIHLEDQITTMGNHGFTRHALFKLEKSSPTAITLSFESTEETLRQYPYLFKLWVTYTLENDRVVIQYDIENRDTKDMPFSFGLHPAFKTKFNGSNGTQIVEFPCLEKKLPISILQESKHQQLHFTDHFFESTPTLILEAIASPYVTLIELQDQMSISTTGYRWLAFWKKPQASFLCIEPWHGHDDFEERKQAFKDREGTLILQAGHTFTSSVSLHPHQGETHV